MSSKPENAAETQRFAFSPVPRDAQGVILGSDSVNALSLRY